MDPAALQGAARDLARAHQVLYQHQAELAGDRSARMVRMQFGGERGLPWEDVRAWARRGPEGKRAVVELIRDLLDDLGLLTSPLPALGPSVARAGSQLARVSGAFSSELLKSLEDGAIDEGERDVLRRTVDDLRPALDAVAAALARGESA